MSLHQHLEHPPLGEYEGHPIITPLRDANDHLEAALAYRYRVGMNRENFQREIALLRAGLELLEADYGGRTWQ